jgi:DNA-binding transcriptional MerR regulator
VKRKPALQIVTLLRKTGYNLEATRTVLSRLATGIPQQALQAAQQRLNDLSATSRRCAEATAAAWEYMHGNFLAE